MAPSDNPYATVHHLTETHLQEGITLARSGERDRAREVFRRIIQINPEDEQAWLWLAWVAPNREESRRYLEEGRAFVPQSARLAEALRWASGGSAGTVAPAAAMRLSSEQRADLRREMIAGAAQQAQGATRATVQALATGGRALGQGLATMSHRARALRWPTVDWARVRTRGLPVLAGVAIVALLTLAGIGMVQARERSLRVLAEVLPPVADGSAAAPSPAQRAEPLWAAAESALASAAWDTAIELLEQVRDLTPRDDRARQQLAVAYLGKAQALLADNDLVGARLYMDHAVRADAGIAGLQEERRLLAQYLRGVDAYWVKDWSTAVTSLARVFRARPEYKDTALMLGQAYYELGATLQADRKWFDAQEALNQTLELMPDHPEVPARLAELELAITPPRRIEVLLSKYSVSLYEDDEPVRTFTVCLGRPTAPTLPGRYEVKTKLPSAYGAQWDLDMPYWLGIYDVGTVENGFHALPILSNGATLWAGSLGTGCSFGCIVLATADAEYMYNWAEVGTVVYIRR